MQNFVVHKICELGFIVMLWLALAGAVEAATLHLTDGTTVTGDIVVMDERGIVLKLADGTFSDHVPWGKLSQPDLRDLQQDPKAAQFVEPFIELTVEDKKKQVQIDVQDVPHFQRPAGHSLIGGLAGSGIGVFILLVLYGANIYAGYEISIFRSRPAAVVCGVSAIAPVIGPVIFLSLKSAGPSVAPRQEAEWKPPAEEYLDTNPLAPPTAVAAPIAGQPVVRPAAVEQPAETEAYEAESAAESKAPAKPAGPALPATKTFHRGQYTFNRRFFETQMPAFFGIVRSGADKDLVLSIKSARGAYVGQRISRISANDIQLLVQKGSASEDVIFPFVEIQEVQIKHRDA